MIPIPVSEQKRGKCPTCGKEIKWILTFESLDTPVEQEMTKVWVYFTDIDEWGCVWGFKAHYDHRDPALACPVADKEIENDNDKRGSAKRSATGNTNDLNWLLSDDVE